MHRNRETKTKASDEHSSSDDEYKNTKYRVGMSKEDFDEYLEYILTQGMSAKNKALIKKYEGDDIDE